MRGQIHRWAMPLTIAVALTANACSDDSPDTTPTVEPTVATTDDDTPSGSPVPVPSPSDAAAPPATPERTPVRLVEVAGGFQQPVQALPAPGAGLLVVEQPGRVRLVRDGQVTTFLDLTDRVTSGGERGLLAVALAPEDDDRLLVHYSGAGGRTTLSSFTHDGEVADPSSEAVLLTVDQPASNHNGGGLVFGPDGMLYLGLGDGGAADDRFGNGQRPDTLLGTILRLDVSAGDGTYAVPPDNPFVDGGGAPEVWAYGLRNPWRFAFGDGTLYIADVGQNAVEEVDAVDADAPGVNYGWPLLEGPDCFASDPCDEPGLTGPVAWYRHADTGGCAVIGGVVHAGSSLAWLDGTFLYADTCSGLLRGVRRAGSEVDEVDLTEEVGGVRGVLGFGTDPDGETLITLADGRVLRLAPA